MSAIQNHKTLWRKKRQCCYAKDVKGIPKTARHVKIAESKCRLIAESILPNGCSLHILCRYVDNIFCAFDSKDEMDKFFHNLNKVHSSVGFSKEVEADGQLTYLDVLLTKNEKGIETTIYRKILIQDCKTNRKACRQYNKKSAMQSSCYIVSTKFAAHTNWSTKNFNILNPVFLAMDTWTGL